MTDHISQNIEALEAKVDELLALSARLASENKDLQQQLYNLKTDRSVLVEQKEHVRTQVESMIARLKAMETA